MKLARLTGLVAVFLFTATWQASAGVLNPCKQCAFFLCQEAPFAQLGKDLCNDTPKVDIQCTFGFPGGLSCGPTISMHCETSGGICMNWMEFVLVQGAVPEGLGCDDALPATGHQAPSVKATASRHAPRAGA